MVVLLFWLGILMMALAGGLLLWTDLAQQVTGVMTIAILLGVGLLISAGAKAVWVIRRVS